MTLLLHIPWIGLFNHSSFPLSTHSLPAFPLPPPELWSCRRSHVWGRAGGELVLLFQCCLQLPLVVWCLVLSCQGLRIWGRTDEEKSCFQHCRMRAWQWKVCVSPHTQAVCAANTPTQQAQFSALTQVWQTPASGPQHTSFVLKGHINII